MNKKGDILSEKTSIYRSIDSRSIHNARIHVMSNFSQCVGGHAMVFGMEGETQIN
jgi:hypothetical protein